jgi:hypothetical protein
MRTHLDDGRRVDQLLADLAKPQPSDPLFERYKEMSDRLKAALPRAAARRGEVARGAARGDRPALDRVRRGVQDAP